MSRQWVAGDVALVTFDNAPGVVRERGEHNIVTRLGLRRDEWWVFDRSCRIGVDFADILNIRPLVVIDPDDTEAVERLVALAAGVAQPFSWRIDEMQQALRTYASPEVEEPQELGACVRAALWNGNAPASGPGTWTRAETGQWVCLTDGYVGRTTSWAFLRDVEVLDA